MTVYNLKIIKAHLKLKNYSEAFVFSLKVIFKKQLHVKYALKYV